MIFAEADYHLKSINGQLLESANKIFPLVDLLALHKQYINMQGSFKTEIKAMIED